MIYGESNEMKNRMWLDSWSQCETMTWQVLFTLVPESWSQYETMTSQLSFPQNTEEKK